MKQGSTLSEPAGTYKREAEGRYPVNSMYIVD